MTITITSNDGPALIALVFLFIVTHYYLRFNVLDSITFRISFLSVAQAEARLALQANIVESAKSTSAQNNATSKTVNTKITSIEEKLARLKSLTTQIPFAIQFDTHSSSVYILQGYSSAISKVLYNSAGFDMKANSSNGIVLYILSQPGQLVSFF